MQILIAGDIANAPAEAQAFLRSLRPAAPAPQIPGGEPGPDATRFVVAPLADVRSKKECDCGPVDLDDQPEQLSAVLDAIGIALLHRGCVDEAAPFIERALELRRRLFGEDHPFTAQSYISHARVLRMRGKLDEAEADARRGLGIDSRVYGGDSYPIVGDLVELGAIQLFKSEFTNAEQSALHGLAILQRLHLEHHDPNTTRLKDILGRVQQTRGEYEKATSTYREIFALDREQVGEHHLKFATHLGNFATVELAQGKLKDAEDNLDKAISILENDVHRPKHPNRIDMLTILGSVQIRTKNPKARDTLMRALELNKQVRGEDSAYVGTDYTRLGRVEYEAGNYDGARDYFNRASAIYAKRLPATHAFVAEAKTWWGRALIENPKRDAKAIATAKELLTDALRIWSVEFGERSVEQAIANALLGRTLYLEDPNSKLARELLAKSQPIVIAVRGADSAIAKLIAQWINEIDARNGSQGGHEPKSPWNPGHPRDR
jgi:tetratricopeptide (TPR) repeat protein